MSRRWRLTHGNDGPPHRPIPRADCGITAVDVVKAALEEQLLVVPAGAQVVRMVPALVINAREIQALLTRLERALNRVS